MQWTDILEIRESNLSIDFRLLNQFSDTYGEYYVDRNKIFINLIKHESINNILDTINHEALHACLKREDLNDDVEHMLLYKLMWEVSEND